MNRLKIAMGARHCLWSWWELRKLGVKWHIWKLRGVRTGVRYLDLTNTLSEQVSLEHNQARGRCKWKEEEGAGNDRYGQHKRRDLNKREPLNHEEFNSWTEYHELQEYWPFGIGLGERMEG
jgi:hypothetical protein